MDLGKTTFSPAMRAGHADRERYVGHLLTMMVDGFLDHGEFSARRDLALEAVTVNDLTALVRDLPRLPEPPEKKPVIITREFGTDNRFRPWKWGLTLAGGLALVVSPGPLWAAAAHGMGNTPGNGVLPLSVTFVSVIFTVVFGILWGPGEKEREE
jgi:hypothetical protein